MSKLKLVWKSNLSRDLRNVSLWLVFTSDGVGIIVSYKLEAYDLVTGQETFFSIHLSLGTSTMCILLVQTTKLLVQK